MDKSTIYKEEFLPGIIKWGKITNFLGCILVFVPALIVTFGYGIIPDKGPFMVAIVAQLSVNAVWWVIEPISFFPVIGVLVGVALIGILPASVKDALNYLLPALFGAVFAQFAIDDWKTGIVAMGLGIVCMIMYNNGLFNWLPIDPFVVNILIPIFGTMLYAKLTFKPKSTEE